MYTIDFKLINGYSLKNWFFKMILRISVWRITLIIALKYSLGRGRAAH